MMRSRVALTALGLAFMAAIPVSAFVPAGVTLAASRKTTAGRAGISSVKMGLFDNVFGGGSKKPSASNDVLDKDFRPSSREDGVWEEYSDDRGSKYYYNTATQETLWEKDFMERTRQISQERVAAQKPKVQEPAALPTSPAGVSMRMPLWMQNANKEANAPSSGPFQAGGQMDPFKFRVAWRQGGGTMMQQGGFGYVFFGTYDARPNPNAKPMDMSVCIKLPNTDPDAIMAHNYETEINKKISREGGIPGVADFLGTVDLSPIAKQLPPGIGSQEGMVWTAVQGKTLDQFFDRGGGMSPIIANTLKVTDSKPTQLPNGRVVYIKTNLCRKVLGEALLPLAILHDKGIIHRDLKPKNIMLAEKDQKNPFCIIDFGSAIEKGKNPFMNDFTAMYAPPEAPIPDGSNPFGYDIYTVGIIGLRILMPSLVAGENGIQTLGSVTTKEIPSFDHDLEAWARARATDLTSSYEAKPLNAECEALLQHPDLLQLLKRMLAKRASDRPSADQCLAALGPEWTEKLARLRAGKESRGNCGKCGQPVFSNDKGRFRDSRGIYFHAACQSD